MSKYLGRKAYGFRLGRRSKAQLDAIAAEWEMSNSEVMMLALDLLCRVRHIKVPEFPPEDLEVEELVYDTTS